MKRIEKILNDYNKRELKEQDRKSSIKKELYRLEKEEPDFYNVFKKTKLYKLITKYLYK